MSGKWKRAARPTVVLLTMGFSVSLMSVLIGVSTIGEILNSLSGAGERLPVFDTMRGTGLSLALSIYLFSVVNCLVVTNYWAMTVRRDLAVRKAFGWSNCRLISAVAAQMARILLVSLCAAIILTGMLSRATGGMLSLHFSPFFLCGTVLLLLVTMAVSLLLPVIRIIKVHPAEVIS